MIERKRAGGAVRDREEECIHIYNWVWKSRGVL